MTPCVTDIRGKVYPSQMAAAAAHGVSPSAVAQSLYRRGNCDRVGLGPARYGNTNATARSVTLLGMQFRSVKKASEALGVSRQSIRRFLAPACCASTFHFVYAAALAYGAKQEADARKAQGAGQ